MNCLFFFIAKSSAGFFIPLEECFCCLEGAGEIGRNVFDPLRGFGNRWCTNLKLLTKWIERNTDLFLVIVNVPDRKAFYCGIKTGQALLAVDNLVLADEIRVT